MLTTHPPLTCALDLLGKIFCNTTQQDRPHNTRILASDDTIQDHTMTDTRTLSVNVAQSYKNVCQSSTYFNNNDPTTGPAARAVDGDTNGAWDDGSLSCTNNESDPWWIIELPSPLQFNKVKIWNRNAVPERLSDPIVSFILDGGIVFQKTHSGAVGPSWEFEPGGVEADAMRIQMLNLDAQASPHVAYLTLAEVEIFGVWTTSNPTGSPTITDTFPKSCPVNIALNKNACQSSTSGSSYASNAVDGNTSGAAADGSTTETTSESNPWLLIELGGTYAVDAVTLWNRAISDGGDEYTWLENVEVTLIFDENATGQDIYNTQVPQSGGEVSFNPPIICTKVRVRLTSPGTLSLAEIEVFGEISSFNSMTESDPTFNSDSYPKSCPSTQPNVALNKPAEQSSTHMTDWALLAVDGNSNTYSHTSLNDAPCWLEVDLEQVYAVDTVKVWNRNDCCGYRLTNPTISLKMDDQVIATITYDGEVQTTGTVSFASSSNNICNKVRIELPTDGPYVADLYLHIGELGVYGVSASNKPSYIPSFVPSKTPSDIPTAIPSLLPSDEPSYIPSVMPSGLPSNAPSDIPSDIPSVLPSDEPSFIPSAVPSGVPSDVLSDIPSNDPSYIPSFVPSRTPSDEPSDMPSVLPSNDPSYIPSVVPSGVPSNVSSDVPSDIPSVLPSDEPSYIPSVVPSKTPSNKPSEKPSAIPSGARSNGPSDVPSNIPSSTPSEKPSLLPSDLPSDIPSSAPSRSPSNAPSDEPSNIPSSTPSEAPSILPSDEPSNVPSFKPSELPSNVPSDELSNTPSSTPSEAPSLVPSDEPSDTPSFKHYISPSNVPSDVPTSSPFSERSNEMNQFRIRLLFNGMPSISELTTDELEALSDVMESFFVSNGLRTSDIESISVSLQETVAGASRLMQRELQDSSNSLFISFTVASFVVNLDHIKTKVEDLIKEEDSQSIVMQSLQNDSVLSEAFEGSTGFEFLEESPSTTPSASPTDAQTTVEEAMLLAAATSAAAAAAAAAVSFYFSSISSFSTHVLFNWFVHLRLCILLLYP